MIRGQSDHLVFHPENTLINRSKMIGEHVCDFLTYFLSWNSKVDLDNVKLFVFLGKSKALIENHTDIAIGSIIVDETQERDRAFDRTKGDE